MLTSLKHAIGFCQSEILKIVATPSGEVFGYSIGNAEWIISETERYFVKKATGSSSSILY